MTYIYAYINKLKEQFPKAVVMEVVQDVSESDFDKQKEKHLSRNALGGSIGIISNSDKKVILVKRSGMHAGWALPGGTVEQGEDFLDAFEREVKEEIGVGVYDTDLAVIEIKQFQSPSGKKLEFLLAVFNARIHEIDLPPPTADALTEGLKIMLFELNELPESMILGDKSKVLAFGPK